MRRFPGALCALAMACLAAAQGEGERWYVVREGDTLTRIAVRHGATVEALASLNGIDPRGVIRIGQRLRLPGEQGAPPSAPPAAPATAPLPPEVSRAPGTEPVPQADGPESHLVEQGETLYALARRYGISLPDLMEWNGMGPKDVLRVGQRLRVSAPRGVSSTAPAAPKPVPVPPPSPPEVAPAPPPAEPEPKPIVAEEKRPPVEPQPDAEPKSPPRGEGEPSGESDSKPAAPSVSTKHTAGSKFRMPLFSKRKPVDSGVYLRDRQEAIDQPKIKRDRWKYIVIHHSGTSKGSAEVFEHYHRMVRGMENGMAYHFVIGNGSYTGDGEIEVGDRWMRQKAGGHLYSEFLNEIAIGICFVGNFNAERPTARQVAACIELVDHLRKICPGVRPKFVLHREINPRPTECPGQLFPGDAMRKRLK
ncbi:MAG: LysM peptidoglycan-binding domain-containing protein [Verrucomicrobiae bacterium]|nr:LysM peptidoglycan-binding domain-containing protein [Verrucomicrobiae bacterium]